MVNHPWKFFLSRIILNGSIGKWVSFPERGEASHGSHNIMNKESPMKMNKNTKIYVKDLQEYKVT